MKPCGEAQEGVDNVQHAEGDADPRGVFQQAAAIEGQAAHILVTLLLLEQLSQGALHKGGGHAEEGGDPHPEQRAGAADADGAGDAQNVARAHPHGGGQQEGGQRRNAGLAAPAVQQHVQAIAELAHLNKAQLEGQENAGTHQQDNGQTEVAQNGNGRIPVQICGEIPEQVGDDLDLFTDRVDCIE